MLMNAESAQTVNWPGCPFTAERGTGRQEFEHLLRERRLYG